MENLRGDFGSLDATEDDTGYDAGEEELTREIPPAVIGQDERRMQVRAYNHWASLLDNRSFPAIEDLDPDALPDFGPYSVVLDFTAGIEDPAVQFLGKKLAVECGAEDAIETLSDVPARSLLSRITDHYMQILANQAPIGFEAEFVNQRGATILYRGILLPFSSDDDTIDFIYGVINWKEMADQQTTDELLLEIDQALESEMPVAPQPELPASPIEDWADGPVADAPDASDEVEAAPGLSPEFAASLEAGSDDIDDEDDDDWGDLGLPDETDEASGDDDSTGSLSSLIATGKSPKRSLLDIGSHGSDEAQSPILDGALDLSNTTPLPAASEPDLPEVPSLEEGALALPEAQQSLAPANFDDGNLHNCLAAARQLAEEARQSEDRTRAALYAAVSRAYDFSLLAAQSPDDFAELVAESGLTVQDRAPLAPVVKLVFGFDYDKTRLAEYAAVIAHAHRHDIEAGTLVEHIHAAEGGLKGIVEAERDIRKAEAGKTLPSHTDKRERLAKKLRKIATADLSTLDGIGEEFALVMVRRTDDDAIALVGEVPADNALFEKAARKLLG